MNDFAAAYGIANAVLYEGYLLFPYTAASAKNRVRWQFGVVVPEAYLAERTGEHARQQTDVLFEANDSAQIEVRVRFLHVEARRVEVARDDEGETFEAVPSLEVAGVTHVTFDEAVECERTLTLDASQIATRVVPLEVAGGRDVEPLYDDGRIVGRVVREREDLRGMLTVDVAACDAARGCRRLRVRVENRSRVVYGERSSALRTSFVSTHVLVGIEGGSLFSVLDPPGYALAATATLANEQTFPVLVGDARGDPQRARLVLSSPIILYDYPQLAKQTEADAFDATEIDELLTLSVLSLSDRERDEARATDPRARAIVERAERFGPEAIARLHAGALHRVGDGWIAERPADPDADAGPGVPHLDCVYVDGKKVARGSSVRLHPGGRADIWDDAIVGKIATVRAIHRDFDDKTYVAVTIDDDPASELHDWYGRSFFFAPHEVEPLGTGARA
ncbi:MAG: hypothetical protein NVS3B17_13710 [Vulcanimicrobiaceae bacterium]